MSMNSLHGIGEPRAFAKIERTTEKQRFGRRSPARCDREGRCHQTENNEWNWSNAMGHRHLRRLLIKIDRAVRPETSERNLGPVKEIAKRCSLTRAFEISAKLRYQGLR